MGLKKIKKGKLAAKEKTELQKGHTYFRKSGVAAGSFVRMDARLLRGVGCYKWCPDIFQLGPGMDTAPGPANSAARQFPLRSIVSLRSRLVRWVQRARRQEIQGMDLAQQVRGIRNGSAWSMKAP